MYEGGGVISEPTLSPTLRAHISHIPMWLHSPPSLPTISLGGQLPQPSHFVEHAALIKGLEVERGHLNASAPEPTEERVSHIGRVHSRALWVDPREVAPVVCNPRRL